MKDLKKIMIVEDDAVISMNIREILIRSGYDVTAVAGSGSSAVKIAMEDQPDMIVMDIKLQGEMDGIDAAYKIRSHHDIPVIYLTSQADEKTLERSKGTHPYGYILKPFREEELLVNIELGFYKHEMERVLKEKNQLLEGEIQARMNAEKSLYRELELNATISVIATALLAEDYSVEKIAGMILQYAKRLTDSDYGFASSIDPKTLSNVVHTFGQMMNECNVKNASVIFHIGKDGNYPGLWGYTLNTRTSLYTNSPQTHPAAKGIPEGHIPIDRFLSVPVLIEGTLIGQISLANSHRDYTDQDVSVIEQLAHVYALVLHRNFYEKEKEELRNQLQHMQKIESIGVLAGGIAHDFNNILFPIFGYVEMLLAEAPVGTRLQDDLTEILHSAIQAKELVQQILTFSRQTAQELKPIRLHLILREVLKLMRASLPASIQITEDIRKDCGFVIADTTQIHQIVVNLITNAFHFEPYFTTKPKHKGTGLGLSVVHGIVKSYKGGIRIQTCPDNGTIFRIFFPRVDGQEETQSIHDVTPLKKGKERILLVDDESGIIKMEQQLLKQLGYDVAAYTKSVDALETFRQSPNDFDLIITDLTMPMMAGDTLSRELLRIRPEIPIILVTGFSEKINEEIAEEMGIKAYLFKPINIRKLAETIRRILDKT